MGRSVSYPSAALVVTYRHLDIEDQDDAEWLFDDMIDNFRRCLTEMFPSVVSEDKWIGREDRVLARNGNALFGISEYCGLVAYWIVAADEIDAQFRWDGASRLPLQERWINSIADRFVATFGELTKVGSMSNGEGVYRQIRK